MSESLARTGIKVMAVNAGGIMIIGAEIVIGITAVVMIASVKEGGTVLAAMTQGATEDPARDQKSAQEIMIATGSVSNALHSLCCLCLPADMDVVCG